MGAYTSYLNLFRPAGSDAPDPTADIGASMLILDDFAENHDHTGTGTKGKQLTKAALSDAGTANGLATLDATGKVVQAPAATPASVLDEVHANTQVVNTTTETNLFSLAIPAGLLAAGDRLRLIAQGDFTNTSGGNINYTFRLKIGATTVLATAAAAVSSSTNVRRFHLIVDIAAVSTSSQQVAASFLVGSAATVNWEALSTGLSVIGTGTSAENTSSSKNVVLSVEMGTASANSDCNCRSAYLAIVKK